jgi:hypothetical protein
MVVMAQRLIRHNKTKNPTLAVQNEVHIQANRIA